MDTVIRGIKLDMGEVDGMIMACTDDLSCWKEDGHRLRDMLICFSNKLREVGLEIKIDKTEIMKVRRVEGEELRVKMERK